MISGHETHEKVEMLSKITMSSEEQTNIWNAIEQGMKSKIRPEKRKLMNPVANIFMAATAVVIVVGGIYTYSHRSSLPNVVKNQTSATTEQVKQFVPPSTISSMWIFGDGSPAAQSWLASDPKAVSKQILTWLSTAVPTSVNIPQSSQNLIFNSSPGPAKLNFTTSDNSTIEISPAGYMTPAQPGSNGTTLYKYRYIDNVVSFNDKGQITYLIAPALYTWLKDNEWKIDFYKAN